MQFKKINYLNAVIISGSLLFSCNNNSTKQDESAAVQKEPDAPAATTEQTNCYASYNDKDTVWLKVVSNGNMVTGNLEYNYFEKDKNKGTINGDMKGDTLLATYTFMSEGKESARQVAFLKNGDEFTEGYGNVNAATGEPDLTDRSAIKFQNKFILKKTDCK